MVGETSQASGSIKISCSLLGCEGERGSPTWILFNIFNNFHCSFLAVVLAINKYETKALE